LQVRLVLIFVIVSFAVSLATAQQYDILLKGGHLIDPRNDIDEQMHIAVSEGKIERVNKNISTSSAQTVIDISGLYVTPGLIDMHVHVFHGTIPDAYLSNSFTSVKPDGFTFRSGVTTVVDVGDAGWKNFDIFKQQVIDRSKTRVLAFLNIIGSGMKGGVIEQNMNDMDPKMTALVAKQHPEIVGIKIAHYNGHDWEPYHRTVKAGEMADIPIMVDFGSAEPPLSLKTLFHEKLRPGDIYTHMYGGGTPGRQAVIDENNKLRDGMLEARERGIIFDIGHGGGSFFYKVAMPAFEQGLKPNTISTDLHTGSMNDGMKNMLNVMSKLMDMGMSLDETIMASTWKPAQVIQREDLGHLSVGAVADIAVLNLREGDFGFQDARENLNPGNKKLEAELTLRAGDIVWDLNGLAAPLWNEDE